MQGDWIGPANEDVICLAPSWYSCQCTSAKDTWRFSSWATSGVKDSEIVWIWSNRQTYNPPRHALGMRMWQNRAFVTYTIWHRPKCLLMKPPIKEILGYSPYSTILTSLSITHKWGIRSLPKLKQPLLILADPRSFPYLFFGVVNMDMTWVIDSENSSSDVVGGILTSWYYHRLP